MRSTFLISPNSLDGFLFVFLILLAARLLPAAEPSPDAPAAAAEQLKQLNDRTIIGSRISLDTEWDQFKHGTEKTRWTLGALWGWRVHDWQDWAVQLKLPFVYGRSDESWGHTDIGGVGDIEVATGTALRLNNSWRTAGGVELHADTASKSTLGDSVWRLKPFWAIAHDVTDWFTLAFAGEYSHSIAEEHNVPPQGYLELSLPATFILPSDWSIGAQYKAKIDFENSDRWAHTVNVGVAKRLSNVPVVLSATLEKPLNGDTKNFQANFTVIYYFKRYHPPK
jgi:hypothetical protein